MRPDGPEAVWLVFGLWSGFGLEFVKVVKAWTFKSGGKSGGFYQTLLYADGSTSCDCKGWTLRCKNGLRMCKHTRSVDMQMADRMCERMKSYEVKQAAFQRAERVFRF